MDHHQLHNDNHTFWNWEGTPHFTSHLNPDQPVPGSAVIGSWMQMAWEKTWNRCRVLLPMATDLTKADLQVEGLC